jgi:hypothetical protein
MAGIIGFQSVAEICAPGTVPSLKHRRTCDNRTLCANLHDTAARLSGHALDADTNGHVSSF